MEFHGIKLICPACASTDLKETRIEGKTVIVCGTCEHLAYRKYLYECGCCLLGLSYYCPRHGKKVTKDIC